MSSHNHHHHHSTSDSGIPESDQTITNEPTTNTATATASAATTTNNNNGTSLPDTNYMQQYLRSCIIHSLDTFNYTNAEFISERLLAIDGSNLDSIYLYCLSLFHQHKYKSCYHKLIQLNNNINNHLGCCYIFGKCCLKLDKCKEGIYQLLKVGYMYNESKLQESFHENEGYEDYDYENGPEGNGNPFYFISSNQKFHYESNRSIYPDASSIYHLLGDLYRGINDLKHSALNYTQALKLNQYDFEALQQLCKSGINLNIKAIYKSQPPVTPTTRFGRNDNEFDNQTRTPIHTQLTNPFADKRQSQTQTTPSIHTDDSSAFATPRIKHPSVPDAPLRKSNLNNNNNSNDSVIFTKPAFPISDIVTDKKFRRGGTSSIATGTGTSGSGSEYSKITSRLILQPGTGTGASGSSSGTVTNPMEKTPAKRPVRANLKRNNSSSLEAGLQQQSYPKTTTTTTTATMTTPSSNHVINNSSIFINKQIEKSDKYLLRLFSIFAKAFKSMMKYDCYKAIRLLESLDESQRETPWVLSKLGRLHYEIINYKQSQYYFNKLRKLDRTRLEDMEYYSTLLWHLESKVELTFLANELYEIDCNSAITWCVVGNLFSLIHEPDDAIKCFNKSIKLDSKFTYAYTLKGHEYFGNDNYEMALENFRISLLLDSRHYNALYGIGMIYINLGDYNKANYHFRKAISINPINIILICCNGMVLEKLGKKSLAIKQYELANKLQPLNPLPLFKKAQLLFSEQQYEAALKCFETLKDLAPNEASVHFLLGQLYNIQGDKFLAVREFTIALNLDPKGNYLIREAMESLKEK
ncbi:CDC27 [[Candida] subhashii]|uniref:CDC27 n=1 Tax=[Candida] subhashii TaxID=561895 RepID=A0A8J5QFX7_9ASCO|nr:CDC27 [[Candida] subhashii]KAG7662217.1 CDC27 [[Candida] subhashii]